MSPQYLSPSSRIEYFTQVWDMVEKIPPGKVATYGQIATMIPAPEGISESGYKAFGPRWVGSAMAACPEDVPWQRVINSQGKISLRGASGQNEQRGLLEAEGIIFDERGRVNLKQYRWSGKV